MPFTECGWCGCPVGSEELFDAREFMRGWMLDFQCHCGAITASAATATVFVEWVNGEGLLLAELLEHTSVEELFEFWADQESVDPDSVPVEA